MGTKDIEAQINLPDGTHITLKGPKTSVADILAGVAGKARGQDGGDTGSTSQPMPPATFGTLASVAEKDNGNVRITISDLKAKNAMEAAHRLVYATLLARRTLLNETRTPRKVLVETLRGYNLYDGNSRRTIANDKGLVRDGRKSIWLSQPALEIARKFVKEIQDPNTKGTWGISHNRRRRGAKRRKDARAKSG
jgi:activator of HSP90 ATPase